MGRRIAIIWAKEMLDALRDRRTLVVMIVVPVLMMPVFTLLPQYLMSGQIKESQTGSLVIPIHGAAHAPQLIAFLREAGAQIHEVTTDPEAYVGEDRSRVLLAIAPDFQARMAAEKPAQVAIYLDDGNIASSVAASRIRELLAGYAEQVAAERLASRGLDTALTTPMRIDRRNVATEEQLGGMFLAIIVPMFLILFAFLGGMYTAIDVTAGEKERGTLEPLLAAPIGRTELVIGKLLTVFVTSCGAVILSLLSTFVVFQLIPADFFGRQMSFALPLSKILWLIVAALPLILLLNGIEMIICIFARSFKEAQNYITPVQLLLMLPALLVGFIPGLRLPAWTYTVPVLAQVAVFRDILSGDPLNYGYLALSLASASLWAAAAIVFAVRRFEREHVLFRT